MTIDTGTGPTMNGPKSYWNPAVADSVQKSYSTSVMSDPISSLKTLPGSFNTGMLRPGTLNVLGLLSTVFVALAPLMPAVASDECASVTRLPADVEGCAEGSRFLSSENEPPPVEGLGLFRKSRLSSPDWLTLKVWTKCRNEIRLLTKDRSLPETACARSISVTGGRPTSAASCDTTGIGACRTSITGLSGDVTLWTCWKIGFR